DSRPYFLAPLDDFHIVNFSPCRNAGTNDAPGLPDKDFDGDDRILEGTVDIGADEFSTPHGASGTYYVPGDYPSIQEAIDSAFPLDTIAVLPGTYFENINFLAKAVSVQSCDGPELTVMDGGMLGSVVTFANMETEESNLKGFTITNGWPGIACNYCSPTISDNIITGNMKGIVCESSSPLISNNTISYNTESGIAMNHGSSPTITHNTITCNSGYRGGGIYCGEWYCHPIISCNTISHNSAEDGGGIWFRQSKYYDSITNNVIAGNSASDEGGGIFMRDSSLLILNNTLCDNSAYRGGAIHCWNASPTITNTILWNNHATHGPEINVSSGNPEVTCCDVQGGWSGNGNIEADPLFADPGKDDFHLTWLSPCINRGIGEKAPADDLEGDLRPCMGSVDMGADEFTGVHPLETETFFISEAIGGTVDFALDSGEGNGHRVYIVLGSLSNTAPGTPLPGGLEMLRLNWDSFTDLVFGLLNTQFFSGFLGTLDGNGQATAQLNVPPVPGLAGTTMYYAYCLNSPFDFVSNPIPIEIVQ
ncbi:MAG: right-handed parallel beta-helix repeat-containing protein, partial [Planctomycetota bacterium]